MKNYNQYGRTFQCTIEMKDDWPYPEEKLIYSTYIDANTYAQIKGMPDGHLYVVVYENKNVFLEHRSQRVNFLSCGSVMIIVIWNEKKEIFVSINGDRLNSYNDTSIKQYHLNERVYSQEIDSIKLDDELITDCCSEWIEFRKGLLSKEQQPNSYRKTFDEEVDDLYCELHGLQESFQRYFEKGERKEYLRRYILNHLRLLICWQGTRSTYSPLLFRVAAYSDLGLPVYGYKKDHADRSFNDIEGLKEQAVQTIKFPEAYVNKSIEGITIIDLQEWLDSLIYKNSQSGLTINDLIRDCSNKIASHNDRDLSESFIAFEQTIFGDVESIQDDCIKKVASLVLILGKYILEHPHTKIRLKN